MIDLNNSRALSFDQVSAKMIKYGPIELHSIITIVLNECIENNVDVETGFGLLNSI